MKIEKRIDYLISLQEDLRSEIKQRVSQRDGFATQFLIGCGSVITLSFLEFPYANFLIWLMPIVTIFYSLQILYSYVIHDNLTRFLRKHIEPELARLLDIKHVYRHNYFWETRCSFDREISKLRFPGIRKGFFEKVIFFAPLIAMAIFVLVGYFKTDENGIRLYNDLIIWVSSSVCVVIFECIAVYITVRFRRKNELELLGKRDYKDDKRKRYLDKAVFLDRDGTIIVDKVQPKNPSDIVLFEDTIQSLKVMQDKGYLLIIVSNQDGIKQKKLTEKDFHEFNKVLREKLKSEGIIIDAIYYSPHEKSEDDISFKPNPGMLYMAAEDFNLDLQNCYFVGDQYTDYIAGIRAGVKPMYVETGIYKDKYIKERDEFFENYKPVIYKNLTEIANAIEKVV